MAESEPIYYTLERARRIRNNATSPILTTRALLGEIDGFLSTVAPHERIMEEKMRRRDAQFCELIESQRLSFLDNNPRDPEWRRLLPKGSKPGRTDSKAFAIQNFKVRFRSPAKKRINKIGIAQVSDVYEALTKIGYAMMQHMYHSDSARRIGYLITTGRPPKQTRVGWLAPLRHAAILERLTIMARQSLIRLGEVERFPQNYTLARTIVESYFLFATEMNDFDREALIAVALPQSLRNDPQRAERIAWFFAKGNFLSRHWSICGINEFVGLPIKQKYQLFEVDPGCAIPPWP